MDGHTAYQKRAAPEWNGMRAHTKMGLLPTLSTCMCVTVTNMLIRMCEIHTEVDSFVKDHFSLLGVSSGMTIWQESVLPCKL